MSEVKKQSDLIDTVWFVETINPHGWSPVWKQDNEKLEYERKYLKNELKKLEH